MIPKEQLENRGIRDRRVLDAVRAVPRHEFVSPELRYLAYEDRPLSIGHDVTISQPYIVAAMTELLEVQRSHRVLEIGTGSGYQAAVLALLCERVYSIERVTQLAQRASALLTRLGYSNVEIRTGDGFLGWPEQAPFDRILLTAAPAGLPDALVAQLARAGRLVAPIGILDRQELILVKKSSRGEITQETVFPVSFVPMLPGKH